MSSSYDDETTMESTQTEPEESTAASTVSATPSQRARQAELSASKTAFRAEMLASAGGSAGVAGGGPAHDAEGAMAAFEAELGLDVSEADRLADPARFQAENISCCEFLSSNF